VHIMLMLAPLLLQQGTACCSPHTHLQLPAVQYHWCRIYSTTTTLSGSMLMLQRPLLVSSRDDAAQ
jgi:hypothetical protein